MDATAGYLVVDGAGEFLAWAEHVEVALLRSREIPDARKVIRCADEAVVGWKAGKAVRQVVR